VSSKRTDIKFSFLRNRYSGGNVAQIVNSSTRPNIDYNAKGQRERIVYGNAAVTEYSYEDTTFQLLRLRTTRPTFPAAEQIVQDLYYTYDAVGNITAIRDEAQQTIYFHNTVAEGSPGE
jgi:hypothetical protein